MEKGFDWHLVLLKVQSILMSYVYAFSKNRILLSLITTVFLSNIS
jgi:hypothetical protein